MPVYNPPPVVDLKISGNTAGVTSLVSTGTGVFAGGNNITLSQNGQSITISGANIPAATTLGVAITGGNTAGATTSISAGYVSFYGGNSITLSQSAGSITISGPTVATSAFTLNGTSNSVSLSAGAGIGIGQNASTITFSASIQTSNVSLTALGNTTLSSSGTFSNLLNISGAGIISVGGGAGSLTISATTPTVTNFSTVSMSALGNTTLSSSGSFNNNLQFSGAGAISVGVSLNSVTISGPTGGGAAFTLNASTGSLSLVAGAGIGFASNLSTITISSTGALVNSIGAAGSLSSGPITVSGGNNITITSNGAGVLAISGPSSIVNAFGISSDAGVGGATAGTTTVAQGTIRLAAGSNITLSSSAGVVTIVGQSITSVGQTLSLFGGNNITLSSAANVVGANTTISVTVNDGGLSHLSYTQNAGLQEVGLVVNATGTINGSFNSSLFLQRILIPNAMSLTEVDLALGINFPVTSQGAGSISQSFVLYSLGNSTSLGLVCSTSGSSAWSTGTSTTAGATSLTQFQGGWSGNLIHPMTFGSTKVTAGEYVAGHLLAFGQGSSTWTVGLYGPVGIGNTTTSAVTAVGTSTTSWYSNIGQLAITNVEGTIAHASGSGATITTNSSWAQSGVARTIMTVSATSGNNVTSVSAVTGTFTYALQSVPNFGFIGTNSTTSAFPFAFVQGVMSTGAIPANISVTSAAVTYSGSVALVQPWFALVGV